MAIEVPDGSAAPEQSKADNNEKETGSPSTSTTKKIVCFGVFGLLVIAAILVGVIPDWNQNEDDETEQLEANKTIPNKEDTTFSQPLYFESNNGPFDVKIPLFSEKVTEGYATNEDLKQDLKQLANFFLNDAITQGVASGSYFAGDQGIGNGTSMGVPIDAAPGFVAEGAPTADSSSAAASEGLLDDADAFETNNQEFTIDRADFVKSDGNLVFAAYSDYLVVWTTDGTGIISQIQMPPLNITGYIGGVVDEPPVFAEDTSSGGDASSGTSGGSTGDAEPAIAARSSIWWNPKPRIEALLLHQDRLTVVVSGYGWEHSQNLDHVPILYEYLGTRIQVYDINGGDLQKVSETDVNGSFRNAYSVDENAYIVTQSSINTWEHLLAPVQRWQPQFDGLDDDEYVQAVTDQLADEGLVESFVDQLVDELRVNGEIDLAQLSLFADSVSDDHVEDTLFIDNTGKAVTQVVAFDMTVGGGDNIEVLQPHISATFQTGSWGQVYAVGSMIIVADQGWSWIEEENRAAQKTYLLGFRLEGAASSHQLVGMVPGYLLNPFSLDFVEKPEGSYVRIATTQSFWTPWLIGPVLEGDVATMTEEAAQTAEPEPESTTINQIIVLKVPTDVSADNGAVLKEVGSLQLGEPNEIFTAVRFFDNFAYAVTFEQTDPFYVIDLSNEQPKKSGELKVSGFSQYLHPIDSEDKFLVSVGQEADDSGNILGIQISLFDATNSAKPSLIDRLVVEQEKNTWSSTSASWDERAFRFLPLGERTGKLIIPVSMYTYQEFDEATGERLSMPLEQSFEGFSVFNIDIANNITKDFDIDHSFTIDYTSQNCNYWYDWLPERSFVFSGNVMTMKQYTVISTSLSTGETLWSMPIDETLLGCQV